eukprot:TRINITY_DN4142_c0_g1_i1.p1 TRINITY_DN4142_c0_g1~~TRINITY_DN4142_c0_g1_i1.p1  ORF type:complete len:103 (-),score=33.30 TRINITY_DN4142_c0_g1_i1:358-645(-)
MVDALSKANQTNETEDEDEDIDLDLNDATICSHLRESEIDFLTGTESLAVIPKHKVELLGLEKILLNLTDWALESGSKDNMSDNDYKDTEKRIIK